MPSKFRFTEDQLRELSQGEGPPEMVSYVQLSDEMPLQVLVAQSYSLMALKQLIEQIEGSGSVYECHMPEARETVAKLEEAREAALKLAVSFEETPEGPCNCPTCIEAKKQAAAIASLAEARERQMGGMN